MEQADEMYANDEYEPLNQFWTKYAEADLNAVKSYERREGVQEGKIEVYKNMLTLGYSKEEAMVAAKIPKEVADTI